MLRRWGCVLIAALLASELLTPTAGQALPPPAPRPTSGERSPSAPDPHPPLGGLGPDGNPIGGGSLLSRGLVVPVGAPRLPRGVTARAWMLTDLGTGQVLAARDPHGRYQPASILKVLACLVLVPRLPGRRVVVASRAAADAEGSAVGLVAGGRYSVDTLFEALLLMSGNDAATALAEAGGGVRTTVAGMNVRARSLGAYDTVAQTPSGLDGWQQLTSAYDMTLFLRAVAATPRFLAYDRLARTSLPPQQVGARRWGRVALDNQSQDFFSAVPGALVAKTGYTDAAAHTFLGAAQRHGRRLGVVMLRARRAPTDQWQQAAALLNWGFRRPTSAVAVGRLAGPVRSRPPSSSAPPAGPPTSRPVTPGPRPVTPGPRPVTPGPRPVNGRPAAGPASSAPTATSAAGVLAAGVLAVGVGALLALLAIVLRRSRGRRPPTPAPRR